MKAFVTSLVRLPSANDAISVVFCDVVELVPDGRVPYPLVGQVRLFAQDERPDFIDLQVTDAQAAHPHV